MLNSFACTGGRIAGVTSAEGSLFSVSLAGPGEAAALENSEFCGIRPALCRVTGLE